MYILLYYIRMVLSYIFQLESSTVDRLFELIIEDVRSWRAAGCIISFY
jgi:hypothetical protein